MTSIAVRRRENPRYRDRAKAVIIGRMAQGKSMAEVCRRRHMPNKKTVMDWLSNDPTFAENYRDAYRDREQHYFEEIVEIADTEPDPKRAKVRMEAREWTLARMNPKKYGQRIQQEVTGADGGPLQFTTNAADLLGKIRGES